MRIGRNRNVEGLGIEARRSSSFRAIGNRRKTAAGLGQDLLRGLAPRGAEPRVTSSDLLAALTQIFRENFDNESLVLSLATTRRDVSGWDSAKTVLLVLAVEERFDIRLRSKEIDALRSIGDWVKLSEKAAAAKPPSA